MLFCSLSKCNVSALSVGWVTGGNLACSNSCKKFTFGNCTQGSKNHEISDFFDLNQIFYLN